MLDTAYQLLREKWGYDTFRGDQQAIIETVLAGRDSLVLMPTGGGKSLCYQLPALLRHGTGIVISPLIALMQDQVDAMLLMGIRAAFLNSTLEGWRQAEVINALRAGQLDLLYVAPERLLQDATLALLDEADIALFAVDEAHCVSQWGHDFRADYLGLHVLAERYPRVPRMALTATADGRTRSEIVKRLALVDPQVFVASFDRPNIRYTVQAKTEPRRQLQRFLLGHDAEAGIIYCNSRARVERTAEQLRGEGWDALPYHAGLSAEVRARHQERFLREDGVIIVATIAFGMGIDKPDVRFVAHLDLPKSIEAYYQETGRAGRDGLPAEAWMIYGLQDVVRLRQMVDQSPAEEQFKRIERGKLDALLGWCELTHCRRQALLRYFDEELPTPCGNCDVCLTPPKTFDATVPAQKLLSCIYRTGQRFGAAHVIDVLRGRSTDKTVQHHHEALSTWGIGRDLSERQWRSLLRQLTVRGAIFADPERYNALRLTDAAKPMLRGEVELVVREDAELPRGKGERRAGAGRAAVSVDAADEPLWQALRSTRKRIATEAGVPPYVVFPDATLLEMVQRRPTSAADLLDIHGVGQARLARYGEAFLDVLRDHEYAR